MSSSVGRRRGGGGGKSSASVKRSEIEAAELRQASRRLCHSATYEVLVDPYRGIFDPDLRSSDDDGGKNDANPWIRCMSVLRAGKDGTIDVTRMQRCPSLAARLREELPTPASSKKAVKRKRAAAGKGVAQTSVARGDDDGSDSPHQSEVESAKIVLNRRPLDATFSCPCDFNPFCLASIGGCMDDYLEERVEASQSTSLIDQPQRPSSKEAEEDVTVAKEAQAGTSRDESIEVADSDDDVRMLDSEQSRVTEVPDDEAHTKKSSRRTKKTTESPSKRADNSSHLVDLRHPVWTSMLSVQSYLGAVLATLPNASRHRSSKATRNVPETSTLTAKEAVEIISAWHSSLLFHGDEEQYDSDDDGIIISLPPGLRNLGATCYLNSQFQCLAQNPNFLRGIFSWNNSASDATRTSSDNQMSAILLAMQQLLARMIHGPHSVVTTDEFALSLHLENNEMQDPNEFARLLFDLIHNAFQRLSCSADSTLENLLPSIFRGTCTYITTCIHCSFSSRRKEDFMDVTLPIVDVNGSPGAEREKGKKKKATSAASSRDVTAQELLDSYLFPEKLDGDNQYFCSNCRAKRDADRTIVFESLPPVLNIQLARYVYDRRLSTKRKVMDKVLLPRKLRVPSLYSSSNHRDDSSMELDDVKSDLLVGGSDDAHSGAAVKEYVLCAVQYHLGTSASGGHYVAEAMDWTTGVWFEFNDETVTVLPHGPRSSLLDDADPLSDPIGGSIADEEGKKPVAQKGSTDSYNVFYCERHYLATAAVERIQQLKEEAVTSHLVGETVRSVTKERKSCYDIRLVKERKRQKTRARMENRRRTLIDYVSRLIENDELGAVSAPVDNNHTSDQFKDMMLVDGDALRRFFSCSVDTEMVIDCPEVGVEETLLCSHSIGLHPRFSRRCKLLPTKYHAALKELSRKERDEVGADEDVVVDDEGASRSEKTSDSDCTSPMVEKLPAQIPLQCETCVRDYCSDLEEKKRVFHLITELLDELDPSIPERDTPEATEENAVNFPFVDYAVSRSFLTNFRSYSLRKMKEATSGVLFMLPQGQQKSSQKQPSVPAYAGLDCVEFSEVYGSKDSALSSQGDSKNEALDVTVNSKIACPHGNCNVMNNSRMVRFIDKAAWEKLQKLFPAALPLLRRIELVETDTGMEARLFSFCDECQLEKAENAQFVQLAVGWASITGADGETDNAKKASGMWSLSRNGGHDCSDLVRLIKDSMLQEADPLELRPLFHLVPKDNVSKLQAAMNLLRPFRNKKKSASSDNELRKKLCDLFSDEDEPDNLDSSLSSSPGKRLQKRKVQLKRFTSKGVPGLTLGFLRRLFPSFVVDDGPIVTFHLYDVDEAASSLQGSDPSVTLITADQWRGFQKAVTDMEALLSRSQDDVKANLMFDQGEECYSFDIQVDAKMVDRELTGLSFSLVPAHFVLGDTESEASMESDEPPKKRQQLTEPRSGRDVEPPLDSEEIGSSDDVINIRVREVVEGEDLSRVVTVLLSEMSASRGEVIQNGLRRSGRVRRTRSEPSSFNEEFLLSKDDLLAKLRLLLWEKEKTPLDQELLLVSSFRPLKEDDAGDMNQSLGRPTFVDLPLDSSSRVLSEIIEEAFSKMKEDNDCRQLRDNFATVVVLMRYSEDGANGEAGRKRPKLKQKADRSSLQESIVASLFEMVNSSGSRNQDRNTSDGSKVGNSVRRSHRNGREERGFRGTLLSGSGHSVGKDDVGSPNSEGSQKSVGRTSPATGRELFSAPRKVHDVDVELIDCEDEAEEKKVASI